MQSKKAIVVILVALMITGGMGYFLQTEHHTVEKLTYNYQGDTGPSVQYTQIDEWTEYNPLENVTGWDRNTANVPILANGTNQYLLNKTVYDYIPIAVGHKPYNYMPQNALAEEGPTDLSPIWKSTNNGGVGYSVVSQGKENNYAYDKSFTEELAIINSEGKTLTGNEALELLRGGYSEMTTGTIGAGTSSRYYSTNFLDFVLQYGNVTTTSTFTMPIYVGYFSDYLPEELKDNYIVDLTGVSNTALFSDKAVSWTHRYSVSHDRVTTTTSTVGCAITYVASSTLESDTYIYNSDTNKWYPAQKNEITGVYKAIPDSVGSKDIGWVVIGTPSEGIQAYYESHTPKILKPIVAPLVCADPTKFVTISEGKVGYWNNKETNGVINILASYDTQFEFNNGATKVSIPDTPYDYVYITLDFIHKDFYCQGATFPIDRDTGKPIVTTVDFILSEYHYPMVISGPALPDSTSDLYVVNSDIERYSYISVNLDPRPWYNAPQSGRNVPSYSVMFNEFVNAAEYDRTEGNNVYYNLLGRDGIVGSVMIDIRNSVATVYYNDKVPYSGSYTVPVEVDSDLTHLTVNSDEYLMRFMSYTSGGGESVSQYDLYSGNNKVGSAVIRTVNQVSHTDLTFEGTMLYAGAYTVLLTPTESGYRCSIPYSDTNKVAINTSDTQGWYSENTGIYLQPRTFNIGGTTYNLGQATRGQNYVAYKIEGYDGEVYVNQLENTVRITLGSVTTILIPVTVSTEDVNISMNVNTDYPDGWVSPLTGATIPYLGLVVNNTQYTLISHMTGSTPRYHVYEDSVQVGTLTWSVSSISGPATLTFTSGWYKGTYSIPIERSGPYDVVGSLATTQKFARGGEESVDYNVIGQISMNESVVSLGEVGIPVTDLSRDILTLNLSSSNWTSPTGLTLEPNRMIIGKDNYILSKVSEGSNGLVYYEISSVLTPSIPLGTIEEDVVNFVAKVHIAPGFAHEGTYAIPIQTRILTELDISYSFYNAWNLLSGESHIGTNILDVNGDKYALTQGTVLYNGEIEIGYDTIVKYNGTTVGHLTVYYGNKAILILDENCPFEYRGTYEIPVQYRDMTTPASVGMNFSPQSIFVGGTLTSPMKMRYFGYAYDLEEDPSETSLDYKKYLIKSGQTVVGEARKYVDSVTYRMYKGGEKNVDFNVPLVPFQGDSSYTRMTYYYGDYNVDVGGTVYAAGYNAPFELGHDISGFYLYAGLDEGGYPIGSPLGELILTNKSRDNARASLTIYEGNPLSGTYTDIPVTLKTSTYLGNSYIVGFTYELFHFYPTYYKVDKSVDYTLRCYEGEGHAVKTIGSVGENPLPSTGCKVFVVSTVVSVDPLGILWGDPYMYLGYYFEEQMTHDTRLLFNAFVKTGQTMTFNGQIFDTTKNGDIIVPLGEDGELIEQHMNGMALDFIENHVYLVFTQDRDKTLDLGEIDNNPVYVPNTSKLIQNGLIVSATGNWYWESGLYDIGKTEVEEYDLLLDGSFGLDMSSAALLMIGIIIICTAIMLYINKEDEFSFMDWVIIGLAILLLLVLAIIG